MKNTVLSLLLVFFKIHQTTFHQNKYPRSILVRHIGESDKPLFLLIFSTSNTPIPIEHYMTQTLVVVSNEEFTRLEKAITQFDSSVAPEKSTNYDYFGSCQITMTDSCRQVMDKPYSRETMKRFFRLLSQQAKTLNRTAKREAAPYLADAIARLR